jgi:hypothetical protein
VGWGGLVTKTEVCNDCGKLRCSLSPREYNEWQRLDWIDGPPTRFGSEPPHYLVFSEVVDRSLPKDFCSWKCILEYSLKQHKRVSGEGKENEVSPN